MLFQTKANCKFLYLDRNLAQAQGAGMAVEDAEALKVALSSLSSSSTSSHASSTPDINALLKQVQAVRYERATLVQQLSRAAAAYNFDIPAPAEIQKLGNKNPTDNTEEIFGYKGAKEWAQRKGMDLPAFC